MLIEVIGQSKNSINVLLKETTKRIEFLVVCKIVFSDLLRIVSFSNVLAME